MRAERAVEQRAELLIFSETDAADFDPTVLTTFLGITPAYTQRKGEEMPSGREREFSTWVWRSAPKNDPSTEARVLEVLTVFEPLAAKIEQARKRWHLGLQLGVMTYLIGPIEPDAD